MDKQDNIPTYDTSIHDDDIADLLEIANDIIDTRGSFNIEGIKKWLPAYSYYAELKETLHPLIVEAVIEHALKLHIKAESERNHLEATQGKWHIEPN
jgi:hypothetical protein